MGTAGLVVAWVAGSLVLLGGCGLIAYDGADASTDAGGTADAAPESEVPDAETVDAVDAAEPVDARGPRDAGRDAGADAAKDANDPACPATYGSAAGACVATGADCSYPEGTCACLAPCVGGCIPKTCADLGYTCGPIGDGCGGLAFCGNCPRGETCGGGGIPNRCGGGPDAECMPSTCTPGRCGKTDDGCGRALDCGACDFWQCAPKPPAGCPATTPKNGASCSDEGLTCSYGACCPLLPSCRQGRWSYDLFPCP